MSEIKPAVPSGEPRIDVERLTQIVASLGDQRKTQAKMGFKLSDGDTEQLRALATALPGLLEANRERDALRAEREDSGNRMMAWLTNLREAMPGQTYTSPTGESIVGAAINRLQELTEAHSRIAALGATLKEVDTIRNSIVGTQTVNWSAHIYPLVAALEKAGIRGQGHEKARYEAMTLIGERDLFRGEAKKAWEKVDELAKDNAALRSSHERAVKAIEGLPRWGASKWNGVGRFCEEENGSYINRAAVLAALSEKADG